MTMTPTYTQALASLVPLIFILAYLPITGAQLDEARCPTAVSGPDTVYSPFTPWWTYYTGSNQQCWEWASCIFIRADESRKQQFSATALVMGLIPLTFKDIAWPGRRLIQLSRPLPSYLEICVRALGMEPRSPNSANQENDTDDLVKAWWLESQLATWTWKHAGLACAVSSVSLLIASMALVLAELYSKRSSLGCVYPCFVLTWFIVAFIPASAHTFFSGLRKRKEQKKIKKIFGNSVGEPRNVATIVSAVQGAEEWWIVQLFWAVFYIAGTLIYTSIMAVTVVELLVWVLASAAMTAACKLLAFFVCLSVERKSRPLAERNSLEPNDAGSASRLAQVMLKPESAEMITR